jgi:hypothetical protein
MTDNDRNEVQVDLDKYQAMIDRIDELEDAAAATAEPVPEPAGPKYQGVKDLASAVDSWRIFPRIFICTYIYLLYYSAMWFMGLPAPTMEQAGLISVIVGAGAAWFGLYANTGSSKQP